LPVARLMPHAKKILVTGGSGMIGTRLTEQLIRKGYEVSHLGRSVRRKDIATFLWNPHENRIAQGVLRDIDVIIHLAGAGIGDKRWNSKVKKEILRSRTDTTRLLKETLAAEAHQVSAFISASGTNYYGLEDPGRKFVESDGPGKDFMARVTVAWESEADNIARGGLRVVKIRTGFVLSSAAISLKRLTLPVKLFVGAALGSGRQFLSWIHVDDLCEIYIKAIEDVSMQGVYNAVAPNPVTNETMTREIARVLNRPLWMPPVPGFIVKLIAGEVAEIVLKGGKISAEKIEAAGFDFQFRTIDKALEDLLAPRKP